MTANTRLILSFCAWIFSCSIIYGCNLMLGLSPFWSLGPIALTAWGCFFMLRLPPGSVHQTRKSSATALLILLAGLLLVLSGLMEHASKHGHWDAWWFWNPRANYLTRPESWHLAFSRATWGTPFTVPVAHSDYPPFLPLLNGMVWSWIRIQPAAVPFLWSVLATLLCCSALFSELAERNIVVAAAALFFISQQTHFLQLGSAQTADVWVGLFLLLAIISGNAALETRNARIWAAAGLALGCGIWMKNEFLLIALCFVLFSGSSLLYRKTAIMNFIAGITLPVVAWAAFKAGIAPPNDLVTGASHGIWEKLGDGSRYLDIWNLPREQILLYYPALPWLLALSALAWIAIRAAPGRYLGMLFVIWLGYCITYLLSPHNIGWHINTSADRLLAHLYPSLIFIVALQCCSVRFSVQK